jgi:hypothetical protein
MESKTTTDTSNYAEIKARVALMSDEQKEIRVEALYALTSPSDGEIFEFSLIMLGGA